MREGRHLYLAFAGLTLSGLMLRVLYLERHVLFEQNQKLSCKVLKFILLKWFGQ